MPRSSLCELGGRTLDRLLLPTRFVQVAQHARQLHGVLAAITALDVASSRARHAAWLGASTPPRFLSDEEASAEGPVRLLRSWHPLLLQPCLPPLPPPLLTEEMQQQMAWDELSRWGLLRWRGALGWRLRHRLVQLSRHGTARMPG